MNAILASAVLNPRSTNTHSPNITSGRGIASTGNQTSGRLPTGSSRDPRRSADPAVADPSSAHRSSVVQDFCRTENGVPARHECAPVAPKSRSRQGSPSDCRSRPRHGSVSGPRSRRIVCAQVSRLQSWRSPSRGGSTLPPRPVTVAWRKGRRAWAHAVRLPPAWAVESEQRPAVSTATAACPGGATLWLNARPHAIRLAACGDCCTAARIQRCHVRDETAVGSPKRQSE